MAAKAPPSKRVGAPIAPPLTREEKRAAARNLGAVYRHLLRYNRHYLPFGSWAIPKAGPPPQPHPGLLAALVDESVYRSDDTRARLAQKIGLAYRPPYELYRADYDAVMPDVFAETKRFAQSSLKQEDLALGNFKFRFEREPGLADRLSTAAAAVLKDAGGVEKDSDLLDATVRRAQKRGFVPATFQEASKDERSALADEGMQTYLRTLTDYENRLRAQELQKVARERIAKSLRAQPDDVLKTLFAHPRGVEILNALSKNATTGIALALELIQTAREAVFALNDELTVRGHEEHALRYPFFVVGAVTAIGFDDVPGFKEYAVAVGQAKANNAGVAFLDFAGMAVACLALVFAGPIGAFVLGAADLALAGTSAGLAFIREREHELAATAAGFREEDRVYAKSEGYGETALSAAAAFLSALALFKARSELIDLIKNRPKNIPEALAAEAAAASKEAPAVTKIDPSALDRKVDGAKGTGPKSSGVTAPPPPAGPPPASDAARMTGNKLKGPVPEQHVTSIAKEEGAAARAVDAPDLAADPGAVLQDPGMRLTGRVPPGSESRVAARGLLGEGWELVDAGITTEVRKYQDVFSKKFREDVLKMLRTDMLKGDRQALSKHIDRLMLPEGTGLRQVEVIVPSADRPEFTKRFLDRAYVDRRNWIVFVESKFYEETALKFEGRLRGQIDKDIWLLERFPDYLRFEYFISGDVTPRAMAQLQELEVRFGNRFRIRQGPRFRVQ